MLRQPVQIGIGGRHWNTYGRDIRDLLIRKLALPFVNFRMAIGKGDAAGAGVLAAGQFQD
jgi:hypothetical protein